MSLVSENLPDWLDVSRETHARLLSHLALVRKWTPTVNLISEKSAEDAWRRHVLDSAQVWYAARMERGVWADIGSGGGFPGLVVAIIARELAPSMHFVFVESDQRKAAFLREAARQLSLAVEVRAVRAENLQGLQATAVSARALAPLSGLLSLAQRLLDRGGTAVFPKGQSFEDEIREARKKKTFSCEVIPSKVDDRSVILRVENIQDV